MSDIKKALRDVQSWPKERLAQFLQQLPQLAEVLDERVHQDAKHGVQIRPPFEYAMILQEEVGEYQKEVTEGYYDGVEFKPELRAELVQVAAVALAALFSYDTRQHYATTPMPIELSPEEHLEIEKGGGLQAEQIDYFDKGQPMNLVAGLSGEIERVAEIEKTYRALGPSGLAAGLMAGTLNEARRALASGDIADMGAAYQELKGYSL